MALLDESELEDFWATVKKYGFEKADFEVTESADPMRGTGVQHVTGTVTIRRKSSGTERTYPAGSGSYWPVQVDKDMARGVYGQPST